MTCDLTISIFLSAELEWRNYPFESGWQITNIFPKTKTHCPTLVVYFVITPPSLSLSLSYLPQPFSSPGIQQHLLSSDPPPWAPANFSRYILKSCSFHVSFLFFQQKPKKSSLFDEKFGFLAFVFGFSFWVLF